MEEFIREEMLIGTDGFNKLKNSRILLFGVGGVGSYVFEALLRSGIGHIDIVDNDTVALSNINRQLIALHSTVGEYKVDVARKRGLDINPECHINVYKQFFINNDENVFDFSEYDYVIDAIDTVSGKLSIIENCKKAGTPVISSMGTGNKLDPTKLEIENISKTSVCPLAKVMRHELKKRGIRNVKVLFSKEIPIVPDNSIIDEMAQKNKRRSTPASISFVPSCAGLIIAGEVVRELLYGKDKKTDSSGI